jgi:hypothetical protein
MTSPYLLEAAMRAALNTPASEVRLREAFKEKGSVYINVIRHRCKRGEPADFSVEHFAGAGAYERAYEDAVVNYPSDVTTAILEYQRTIILKPDGTWESLDFEMMEPHPKFIADAVKDKYEEP